MFKSPCQMFVFRPCIPTEVSVLQKQLDEERRLCQAEQDANGNGNGDGARGSSARGSGSFQ